MGNSHHHRRHQLCMHGGADEMETVDPGGLVQHWKSARIAAHVAVFSHLTHMLDS